MTDTQRQLLAAIIKNPADDDARLVFADALEEGEYNPRAEFIRVQVEFQRHPRCEDVRTGNYDARDGIGGEWLRAFELNHRERELLRSGSGDEGTRFTNYAAWFEPFRRDCVITAERHGWEYRRGFVAAIQMAANDFLKHCDALIWNESMTDVCQWCGGDGLDNRRKEWGCHECGGRGHMPGSGRQPRPIPETAQPIEKVTLTTEPNERDFGTIETMDWATRTARYYRFPGIEFELPPAVVHEETVLPTHYFPDAYAPVLGD